ncbi:MAG: hypothetical protein ACRBCS_01980 [Cellvibrionaceae bacterium]
MITTDLSSTHPTMVPLPHTHFHRESQLRDTNSLTQNGVTVMNFSEEHSIQTRNALLVLNSLLSFASNSEDHRWTTFITTDPAEYFRLSKLKLNARKFRIIYLKNKDDLLWVTWDALAEGNSHTVITQTRFDEKTLNQDVQENLNKAATLGNTDGIFLNNIPATYSRTISAPKRIKN